MLGLYVSTATKNDIDGVLPISFFMAHVEHDGRSTNI